MKNKLDGATVTEAHRKLTLAITGHTDSFEYYAQLIADSEAKATATLRHIIEVTERSRDTYSTATFELAAERDQLRADVDRILAEKGVVVQHGVECLRRAIRAEAKLKSLVDRF